MPPRRSARRAAEASDEESSQKENAPSSPASPRRKRAGPPRGRRGDEDYEQEDIDPGSTKGKKRAKTVQEGSEREVKVKTEKVKEERAPHIGKKDRALTRDIDGFVTGSIVRVKLHNFVTYDDVEFCPGPHLNMIIGPNGTGKSSIACAIALGLNYHPSILGRATELNAFVKMGCSEGFIEIELKGPVGAPNVIIRRKLSAKSKTSSFTIDGRQATGRDVQKKMTELNIQVDNLCSFLPQDRVSEFAHMNPQQLLRETERSAGDDRLTAWHDALVDSGKQRKELTELLEQDTKQLETLQERNAALERDVQRFNERKEIERTISLLDLVIPFMEYIEARDRYTKAKEEQRRLFKAVQELQKRHQPLLDLLKRFETRHRKLNEQREDKKRAAQNKFKQINKRMSDSSDLENRADEIQTKLSNLKAAERERVKEIQDLEKSIASLQRQLEEPVEVEDGHVIQDEIRQLNAVNQELRSKQMDLQHRQKSNVEAVSKSRHEKNAALHSLKQLDDESHRKLEHYSRMDPDGAEVVRWLRANKHRFKMPIIEPPALSVTVPNKVFADPIEGCFAFSQLKTFVAQCDEDYRLLNHLTVDTPEALGRKVRISTWFRQEVNNAGAPPMNPEELREMGFDGYAIDLIEYPEGLRNFLYGEVRLHRTPIALNPQRVDGKRAMYAITQSGSGSYIAGRTLNQVTRSSYGRRLPQNMTREIAAARNFVGSTVDPARRREMEAAIHEADKELEVHDAEAAMLANEDRALKDQHNEHKKQHDALNNRMQAVRDHHKRIASMRSRLQTQSTKLQSLNNAPPIEDERETLKKALHDVTKKRIAVARQVTDLVRTSISDQEAATRLGLQYLQVGSNKTALDVVIAERSGELTETMALFEAAQQAYSATKAEAKAKLDVSKEALETVDEDIRETFKAMQESGKAQERDLDDLQNELETQKQKLELCFQTNPGVVDQYERRKAEIEALTEKITERQRMADGIERKIKAAMDNWHPALQNLVSAIGEKFSAAFERIGCAGEIELTEHEDYDKWAITIKVKFRDNEQLQQLNGHRQSGGERSLTTILYLMSLTEQAHAPFSLVDEINQGMDQRAERTVHNELVKTTCGTGESGQYFLITPKLLPDLEYHERMKVLCVNNGEWLTEDKSVANLKSFLTRYIAAKNQHA